MTHPTIHQISIEQAEILLPELNKAHAAFKTRVYLFEAEHTFAAVCGFTFYNKTIEPWAHFFGDPRAYPLVALNMRDLLYMEIARNDCARINIPFVGDDETRERFIRWAGCELEGVMRSAGPQGEDMKIYARVM